MIKRFPLFLLFCGMLMTNVHFTVVVSVLDPRLAQGVTGTCPSVHLNITDFSQELFNSFSKIGGSILNPQKLSQNWQNRSQNGSFAFYFRFLHQIFLTMNTPMYCFISKILGPKCFKSMRYFAQSSKSTQHCVLVESYWLQFAQIKGGNLYII